MSGKNKSLQAVVNELSELGKKATYTKVGQTANCLSIV